MLIKDKSPILSSEITDKATFINRRKIIKAAAGISIASMLPASSIALTKKYAQVPIGAYSSALGTTAFEDVASYTNYYEFSTNKKTTTTKLAYPLSAHDGAVYFLLCQPAFFGVYCARPVIIVGGAD